MNCDCSGVIGAALASSRDTWIVWKNWTNAHGGIDGHPIKLLYADDNNSASQAVSNVKNFVENDHVIALVNLISAPGSEAAIGKYTEQHHIAIVGNGPSGGGPWASYWSMFPSATDATVQSYAWAGEMKAAGANLVASVYCSEASACTNQEALWKKRAQQIGLTVKREFQESLANPSYTADCAQARSDGVKAIVVIEDGASANRVGRDCSQQGYHPTIVDPDPAPNPPAALNGAVAPVVSFPWMLTSGSPAVDEYGQAMKQYYHGECTSYCSLGWTNGKLLQKALTGHVSATPTAQDVLNGLWAIHNDTLGGLAAAPITFHKMQPPDPIKCAFRVEVKNATWVAPVGMKPVDCL